MNISTITDDKSSINYGSTIPAETLELISISGSSVEYPFGDSEKDVIEKAFYDQSGNLLNWSIDYPDDSFTQVSGRYINLNNDKITYSFNRFNKTFETVDGKVVLFPANDLASLGYQTGAFKSVYLPIKNVVGNNKRPLSITEISNSRKEIKISYSMGDEKTKSEYIDYINGTIRTKEVLNDITNGLENLLLTDYFQSAVLKYPELVDIIKQKYSFNRDSLIMFFVSDLFNGTVSGERKSDGNISVNDSFSIKDQTINDLYTKYELETTFDAIRESFSSISRFITNVELTKISNKTPTEDEIEFFTSIFNSAFYDVVETTKTKYIDNNYGLLKDVLNLGKLDLYNIVNKAAFVNESNGEYTLLVLLESPLEDSYKVGTKCYISNISPSFPIVQNILLYRETSYVPKQLRGPNFSVISNNNGSSGTKLLSQDDIYKKNVTGSLSTLIENYYKYDKASPPINVDYTKFEKFVKFSSITNRIDNFERKLNNLTSISRSISLLEQKTDIETISDVSLLKERREEIIGSFDGYEKYLYNNSSEINYDSASYYDKYNNDSLENNVPVFIREDDNNSDYIRFVRMVGHMFDNIWVYIDNMPSTQATTNDGKTGNASPMISTILESFGWKVDVGSSSETLSQLLFSKTDFEVGQEETALTDLMSSKERTESIWRRMLVNLPIILKTLGTEEAIRCILSCYGVPRSLIRIREYGGITNAADVGDKSVFKFDSVYHAVKFSEGNEYIEIPWDNGEKTVEFKVRFDPNTIKKDGQVYRFLNCGDRWVVGASREKGDVWGKLFFSITNGSDTKTLYTDNLPIFNGSLYNVMLREFDSQSLILGQTGSMDLTKYELTSKIIEDSRQIFAVSSSLYLNTSYSGSFQNVSGSGSLRFGNQLSSGSLEEFYGNIDQVKTWRNTISEDSFDNHSTLFDAFDIGTADDTVNNIIFRLNFDGPENLYSPSGIVSIPNGSPVESVLTASVHNFPTSSVTTFFDSVSRTEKTTEFPYQFERFEYTQEVKIPNFGGNRYDSEKIRKLDVTLNTDLSSISKASSNLNTISSTDNKNLGVYLSPTDPLNDYIIKFFGGADFQGLIGDPSDLYSNKYVEFEKFKRRYAKYINTNIDFTTFFNAVKGYIDKSLFDQIKRSVPARANLVTGILIEPTLLERVKIQSRPVEVEVHNNYNTKIEDIQKYQASMPYQERTRLSIPQAQGRSVSENYTSQFVDCLPDKNGYGIFAINGFTVINGENYYVEVVTYTKTRQQNVEMVQAYPTSSLETFKNVYNDGKFSYLSKQFQKINVQKFTDSGQIISVGTPLNGYWHTHHRKMLTIPHAKTSRLTLTSTFVKNEQNVNTTVDDEGNLNGDLPFYSTVVDRGRPTVTTQGNQNILGAQG